MCFVHLRKANDVGTLVATIAGAIVGVIAAIVAAKKFCGNKDYGAVSTED